MKIWFKQNLNFENKYSDHIFNFPDMQSKMNIEHKAKQSWSSG